MASERPSSAGQGGGGLSGFLVTELGTLIQEAKKKNTDVKEAAELLLALVKSINPSTASRTDAFARELAKTSDTVRPFLLACESKNPKLVPIAISCLQRLTLHQAIPASSVAKVLKTLGDALASLDQGLQLKMLQTVLPLLTAYKLNVGGDALVESLNLCYRLEDSKSPVVSNIASATMRQIVLHAFEKVAIEDDANSEDPDDAKVLRPFVKDAYMLLQDLCQLSIAEATTFWRVPSMSKGLCLELIESILSEHHKIFQLHTALLSLVKERVCPLVMRSFSDKAEFPLLVRLVRVTHTVTKHFHQTLPMECEVFLSLYIKLLETENGPLWTRVLILESVKGLAATDGLIRAVYETNVEKIGSLNILQELLGSVARIIVSEKQASLIIPRDSAETPASSTAAGAPGPEFVGVSSGILKVACLEQLEKSDAPTLPAEYITSISIQCIINVAEAQAAHLLPRLMASTPSLALQSSPSTATFPSAPILQDELLLAIEMATSTFPVILAVLSVILLGNVDLELYKSSLKAYAGFTTLVGLLGLVQQRDALISTACRIATPPHVMLSCDASAAVRELTNFSTPAAQNFQTRITHPVSLVLGERNLLAVVSLANVASQLQSVLDRKGWFVVLDTLQAVEGMHSSGRTERRETVNPAMDSMKMMDSGRKLSLNALTNAANALTAAGPTGSGAEMNLALASKNLFEASKWMEEKALKEFVAALCMLSKDGAIQAASNALEKKLEIGKTGADDKLFAVAKLYEVVVMNNARIVLPSTGEIFRLVVACLIEIAHSANCTASIRAQVCSVFGDVLTSSIQAAEEVEEGRHGIKNGEVVEMELLEPLKRFMLVSAEDVVPTGVPISSSLDVERVVKGPWFVDVQKAGLETVKKILMSSGHNLVYGWFLIFEVIRSVIAGGRKTNTGSVATGVVADPSNTLEPSQPTKASFLVRTAFPSVQLVCGDFLGSLGPDILYEVIQTLGCFGSQPDDINISLTTIGLLWNISDSILTRRQKLEKEGKGSSPVTRSNDAGLTASSLEKLNALPPTVASNLSIPQNSRAMLTSRDIFAGPVTTKTMDVLWMHLLAHLSLLCSDLRPEVRNSANQTIFKTIGINGKRLSLEAWDECIWSILFPLLERVKISSEQAELIQQAPASNAVAASGIPINPRDSPTKFWNETKTLTLTGITGLIIQFFPVLIELGAGFDKMWSLFLDYIRSWSIGGSPEVAAAAIKSFKTLVRYPKEMGESEGGAGKLSSNIQSRLPELWRVAWDVWESIGVEILADADENKGSARSPQQVLQKSSSGFGSQLIEMEKLKAIHGTFPQATLVQYVSVFTDIHEVISSSFGLYELKRLLNVLSSLLLYHTNSPPGATASKYKTDNISDLENMSPYQDAVFALITGTTPDFSVISGAPEVIILSIAGFIRLPFVRLQDMSFEELRMARQQPATGGMEKGFTYMCLARKSIQTLVSLYESHGNKSTIYSGGIFEATLACLDMPMRAKYDCPCPGTKNSSPLWRCAANTSMTLVAMGLKNLDTFVNDLPKDVLNGIYHQILDMFDGFLLPQSNPASSMSVDELEVATDFDISIFETFEEDVLLHLGQLHVADELIQHHVEIISRCSKLYKSHMSSMTDLSLPTAVTGVKVTPRSGANSVVNASDSSRNGTGGVGMLNTPVRKILKEDIIASPRGSVVNLTSPKSPVKMNLGTDVTPLGRERFSKACLVSLLKLCSDEAADKKEVRYRIAAIAAPIVLEKMRDVLKSYSSDRPLYGRLPLPRIRGEEILIVLTHLRDLEMRVGVLHEIIAQDKIHPLRSHILSGKSAHLFYLYPQLCDLMSAVAKAGKGAGLSPADVDEESVVDLYPNTTLCEQMNWDLGEGSDPYDGPIPANGQQVYIKDEYNFCIMLPNPDSPTLQQLYYSQNLLPSIVQAEGFAHAFCIGSHTSPGARSLTPNGIISAHVIERFDRPEGQRYIQIHGLLDCNALQINCTASSPTAFDDGGQYDGVPYRNCGKEPHSGVDTSSLVASFDKYIEQAGDGIFCMRICEGGMQPGDPCDATKDALGCKATFGISDEDMVALGFSYSGSQWGGGGRRR
ncbi:hypothetical protein HDU98_011758 [Podochytrium sp. JEL0797]|nr:hypothetical protein HDU98_011758 [Podochytrium sp. JEL0797]